MDTFYIDSSASANIDIYKTIADTIPHIQTKVSSATNDPGCPAYQSKMAKKIMYLFTFYMGLILADNEVYSSLLPPQDRIMHCYGECIELIDAIHSTEDEERYKVHLADEMKKLLISKVYQTNIRQVWMDYKYAKANLNMMISMMETDPSSRRLDSSDSLE